MSADKIITLDDYPGLADWYKQHCHRAKGEIPDEMLLRTCEALRDDSTSAHRSWIRSFSALLNSSPEALNDFLAAEEIAHRCNAELLEIIGGIGEAAVHCGDGAEFYNAMHHGANQTGLVAFRFLSAWTAFNTSNFEGCIEECDQITEPFASVHTMHGQALLQLGRAKEALEILNIATTLGPSEIVAWFQKAKAHHVLDQHAEAVAALRHCRKLDPYNDESLVYLCMIASESARDSHLWTEAWAAMSPHLVRLGSIPAVSIMMLRIAALIGDKAKAEETLAAGHWSDAAIQRDMPQSLTTTLRILGQRGWMDIAAALLGRATPASQAC